MFIMFKGLTITTIVFDIFSLYVPTQRGDTFLTITHDDIIMDYNLCLLLLQFNDREIKFYVCVFDNSRRDAVVVDHAYESRKFSLRYDNRRHESVDPLFRLR